MPFNGATTAKEDSLKSVRNGDSSKSTKQDSLSSLHPACMPF